MDTKAAVSDASAKAKQIMKIWDSSYLHLVVFVPCISECNGFKLMLIYLSSLVSNSVVKGLKAHPSNRDAIRKITRRRLIHSIICCFSVFVFVWWGDNFFLVVAQTYPKSPEVTTFPE